ncbi:MAG: class I SAM-dependent methyltransferase [Candidatus Methanolliviera hydrocarbonicum]|uniref:Class I SAM-dependent methyltransferase n=1 Tax=Candidatus Methanolliviera hydrocarbonicum TaxID=2491085 RepID=A0A520KZ05_9EURY|nr:MAG: class I SAM-dependent methyltransferase [Candidatus Methanolliviera hydrocarbonicum]
MPEEFVPADYTEMDLLEAKRFDKKVKENFMPAIISTVKQIIEDYGFLEGVCVEVGCGTAVFAVELCRHSKLKIYALEKEKAIYEVARMNIEKERLTDKIIPVLGDAHELPFENEFADFIISRGSYHCWEDKVRVFKEIYRVLKKGGIALVGGGFGRYVTEEESNRMKSLRDRSLKDDAKTYSSPDILKEVIYKAGIPNFRIIYDKAGLWAEIKK